jgi:hypothetical protein
VEDACYGGFETMVSEILATTEWGWHVDTGLHVLRLILGGVFDRFQSYRSSSAIWVKHCPR